MLVNEVMNAKNTEDFEPFMKGFRNLEYQKSFANNETVKHDLHSNGLISTYDLFNLLADYGEPVNNVDEFVEECGDLEVLEDTYDNTYNYNGYLDSYVNFNVFNLENNQTLVALSVCLGLDPRASYTKQVALVFEDEHSFLEAFDTNFELADFEFAVGDKLYYGGFDASTLDDFGYLTLNEKETDETAYYDESTVSVGDLDDLKEAIADALEVEVENVEISSIDYIWEC